MGYKEHLSAVEDRLMSMAALNNLGNERRSTLNRALKKLKRAKQAGRLSSMEVVELSRELAEALLSEEHG